MTDYLGAARTIASEVAEPQSAAWDRDAVWPEPALRALQQAGLGGLVVPEQHGGLGEGLEALTGVCEALGRADASTAICFGMHAVASACIAARATPDHVERLLKPICAGEHLTTLALSEPGTGSHFYLPETQMKRRGETFVVDGNKTFVTNGGHADSYVMSTVAADPGIGPGFFSLMLVPAEADGLAWGPPWAGWGMRGNSSRSLGIHGVVLPRTELLGAEGDQIWYVFNVVAPYFLVAMTGTYLGVAGRALEEAVSHLANRRYSHSGVALGEVDVLQHRLGTLWAQLQRTRALAYWAAKEADAGGDQALPALCSAKAEVACAAVDIVNGCMTLVGGAAYRDGTVLQRLLRDARAAHVMSPTTDILYTWAGRALLGLPLLGS